MVEAGDLVIVPQGVKHNCKSLIAGKSEKKLISSR